MRLLLILFAVSCNAATLCTGPSATGDGSGSDWNNVRVYTSTPVRGNTYYLSDGDYATLTVSGVAGTDYITYRKATAGDHITDTGWTASMGDGQAVFAKLLLRSSYIIVDGKIGQWSSGMSAYEAYGIAVNRSGVENNGKIIQIGQSSADANYIAIVHVEAAWNKTLDETWDRSQGIWYSYGNNLIISNCWFHNSGHVVVFAIRASNLLIDRSVIEVSGMGQIAMGWSPPEHSELIMIHPGGKNGVIRYSHLRDWRSTGGLIFYEDNDNWIIHGNVFAQTGYYSTGDGAGCISGLAAASGTYSNNRVYNNTFADIDHGSDMGNLVDADFRNNVFVNCTNSIGSPPPPMAVYGAKSYNYYWNAAVGHSETGLQLGTNNPFVGAPDYLLGAATSSGDTSIGSTYGTDMTGAVRGGDGNWDRGAIEFDSGAPAIVATPSFSPVAGTYDTTTNVVISCATAGAAIHYTIDGVAPTAGSPIYTNPVAIITTTILKAIGRKTDYTDSAVKSGTYTINFPTVATPVLDPATGSYTNSVIVIISCATAGATIYYTTDGTTPSAASTAYSTGLTLTQTTTIKAIAIKAEHNDSAVTSGTYTIVPIVSYPSRATWARAQKVINK